MQISAQFDSDDLLRRFEQRRNTAQIWLDSEILRSTEPFVPMDQGDLIGSGVRGTVPGSGLIVYNSPYAHYHYVGLVRVGRAPKKLTDRKMQYSQLHQAGQERGSAWFDRSKKANLAAWIAGVERAMRGKL